MVNTVRHWLLLLILGLSGLVLAGCGGPNVQAFDGTEANNRPDVLDIYEGARGGTTIRVAGRMGAETSGLKEVIPEWEAMTGHKVELVEFPYTHLQEKIFTDVKLGSGKYDVVIIDDPWFPALANEGHLTPLAQFGYQPDSDFVQRSLEVSMWPPPSGPRPPGVSAKETPKLYALPLIGNVQLVLYRNDLITQEPQSLDDLIRVLIEKADPANGLYSYAYRGSGGNPLVTEFNAWNLAYGSQIFDDNWQTEASQFRSVEALTGFQKLVKISHPASRVAGSGDVFDLFLKGEVLAIVAWPTDLIGLQSSAVADKVGIMPMPPRQIDGTRISQLGNWLMAIPTTSEHKHVAFDFMVWATSQETMTKMARATGSPPTRTSVFHDPQLAARYWWFPTTEKALKQAAWRPRTPEWNNVVHVMGDVLTHAVNGMDAQRAFEMASHRIGIVMERAGYRE